MNVLPKRLGAALTAPSSQVSPYTKNCRDLPNTLCFPRIIECFISAWVYPYPESIKLINYFDILTRDKRPSVIVRLCPNVYHSSETKSDSVKSMIYRTNVSAQARTCSKPPTGQDLVEPRLVSIEFKVISDSQMIDYDE